MKRGGLVGADGRSAVPVGIVDHAEGAEDAVVSEEVQKRLNQLFNESGLDSIKAKYKLELAINEERSTIKPYTGMVTAWSNGGFANGGGDESIYFCPMKVDKNGVSKTCSSPIDLRFIGKHAAICPTCRQAVKPKELCGQVGFKLTTQNWAATITRMWLSLEGNADIRLGVMTGGLRARTDDVLKNASLTAGDKLDGTRGKRRWAAYPLKNIIKDTAAGADLQKRIEAFLGQALVDG